MGLCAGLFGQNASMAEAGYYELLGVPHDASMSQIRSAWHRLARAHHPDLNATPEAEAKFKAAQQAYETLSNLTKRREYDSSLVPASVGLGGLEDLFGSLFDTPFDRPSSFPRYTLALSLKEADRGGFRRFTLPDGTALTLDLPPGVEDGAVFRADQAQVEIQVLPDPRFQVIGHDLFAAIEVPLHLALNGGEMQVATLQGQVSLKIAPFTQNGTRLRLRGQGLNHPHGGPKGDLYAQISLRLPPSDTALKRWAKRMPGQASARKA